MKLKKDDSDKKLEYARDQILKNPKMSIANINDRINAQFSAKMNVNRLYRLKREVLGLPSPRPKKPAGAITSAARPGGKARSTVLPQLVHFTPGEHPGELLKRALEDLRAAGLTSLVVVSQTDRYAVIDSQ